MVPQCVCVSLAYRHLEHYRFAGVEPFNRLHCHCAFRETAVRTYRSDSCDGDGDCDSEEVIVVTVMEIVTVKK